MADFRKWLYAFAGVALLAGLTVPASAQSTLMQCAGSANNPLIRAEEYTALAGDVFVTCTGGVPTTVATSIPKATITIFVTNTAITSKLTQITDVPNWNEALLIIDEAGSSTSGNGLENCGSATAPFQTTPADLTCNITSAAGDGTGDYTGAANRPNVFQGRQVTGSFGQAIQFIGVPIDPPGNAIPPATAQPTRTMRITNLRVNAVALNVYNLGNSFSLTTINTTVSFNGTNFGGNQIVNVQNGTVRIGLTATQSTATASRSDDLLQEAASFLQCNATAGYTTNSILLTEGFPTAFKVRNFAQILTNGTPPGTPGQFYQWNGGSSLVSPDVNQNVPNALYNTETGINFDPALSTPLTNPPEGTGSNGVAPAGVAFNGSTGISSAGEVSQGTRFAIRFSGIPLGSNPSVPRLVDLETGAQSADIDTGVIVMICGTDSHGAGGSTAACGATTTVPITLDANGNGIVVYEVAFADPNALEFANVVVYVNPTIDLNATPPVGGTPQVAVTGSANASFAPYYATSTPGVGAAQRLTSSFPIPRFVDNPLPTPPVTLFTYGKCACDMLFPWVVGNSAINTSIVVANTSLDPCAGSACAAGFTAQPQSGHVKFWFFGTSDFNFNPSTFGSATGAATVVAPQTSSVVVPAGSYMAFVISPSAAVAGGQTAGNGLKPIEGPFAGYVIAQSEFQYCHGIASLSGVGLNPQTYLGLVLDKARLRFFGDGGNAGAAPNSFFNSTQLQRTNQAFADELEN
ncbi:MAG: hypothetical protein ABI833_10005 [Acidobacteriota bacterium]